MFMFHPRAAVPRAVRQVRGEVGYAYARVSGSLFGSCCRTYVYMHVLLLLLSVSILVEEARHDWGFSVESSPCVPAVVQRLGLHGTILFMK